MRYVTPFDAGYVCLTEDGSSLFAAANQEIRHLNAYSGQIVNAMITDYPTRNMTAKGCITEVLGEHMDPGLEIDRRRVGERLEAVQRERLDLQLGSPLLARSVTPRPAAERMLSAGAEAASDSYAPE